MASIWRHTHFRILLCRLSCPRRILVIPQNLFPFLVPPLQPLPSLSLRHAFDNECKLGCAMESITLCHAAKLPLHDIWGWTVSESNELSIRCLFEHLLLS